jgi:hypothetical protein
VAGVVARNRIQVVGGVGALIAPLVERWLCDVNQTLLVELRCTLVVSVPLRTHTNCFIHGFHVALETLGRAQLLVGFLRHAIEGVFLFLASLTAQIETLRLLRQLSTILTRFWVGFLKGMNFGLLVLLLGQHAALAVKQWFRKDIVIKQVVFQLNFNHVQVII